MAAWNNKVFQTVHGYNQPCSQGPSFCRLPRAREETLVGSGSMGSSVMAVCCVELCLIQSIALLLPFHAMFKRSLQAEISNSIYSNVYLTMAI